MTLEGRYQVRVLSTGDSSLLRDALDCFADAFDDRDTYCGSQPDDPYLEALLGGDCFHAIVVLEDGSVVGALAGYELHKFEQARSEFYIYDLAVREPHRRRGIATALIESFREIAVHRGGWVVFVQADLGDDPAIALYTKLGRREDVMHFDIPVVTRKPT